MSDIKSILIVEDEIILAMDMQMMLESLGYRVSGIAFSGYDAILRAEQMMPSVVLVDIKLQGPMDGIEAAKHIMRELKIPIIFVTGNTDQGTKQRALQIGPSAYLQKPIDEIQLKTTIEEALKAGK